MTWIIRIALAVGLLWGSSSWANDCGPGESENAVNNELVCVSDSNSGGFGNQPIGTNVGSVSAPTPQNHNSRPNQPTTQAENANRAAAQKRSEEAKAFQNEDKIGDWLDQSISSSDGEVTTTNTFVSQINIDEPTDTFSQVLSQDEAALDSVPDNGDMTGLDLNANDTNASAVLALALTPDFSSTSQASSASPCAQGDSVAAAYCNMNVQMTTMESETRRLLIMDTALARDFAGQDDIAAVGGNLTAGFSPSESFADFSLRVNDINQTRRSFSLKQLGVVASRLAIGLSPLGRFIDACEAISGRQFCLPNGRVLSRPERFFAAASTVLWGGTKLISIMGEDAHTVATFETEASQVAKCSATAPVYYGPANPGPLEDIYATTYKNGLQSDLETANPQSIRDLYNQSVAATFRGGSYAQIVTTEDRYFYRVVGDVPNASDLSDPANARVLGRWFTDTMPMGQDQTALDLALLEKFNEARYRVKVLIPKGTVMYEGVAAEMPTAVGTLPGGGKQYFVNMDPRTMTQKGLQIVGAEPLAQSGNGIVR